MYSEKQRIVPKMKPRGWNTIALPAPSHVRERGGRRGAGAGDSPYQHPIPRPDTPRLHPPNPGHLRALLGISAGTLHPPRKVPRGIWHTPEPAAGSPGPAGRLKGPPKAPDFVEKACPIAASSTALLGPVGYAQVATFCTKSTTRQIRVV